MYTVEEIEEYINSKNSVRCIKNYTCKLMGHKVIKNKYYDIVLIFDDIITVKINNEGFIYLKYSDFCEHFELKSREDRINDILD